MKFLAILRDSIREALDYKVIYFLFGLSGLVILAAASISYKPESGEKGLQAVVSRLPGAERMLGLPAPPLNYEVEDFKQVNESRPVWEGEFRFDLVVSERGIPAPGSPEPAEEEKPQKKDKKPPEMPSTLRLLALVDLLRRQSEGALDDEEDRSTFEKLKNIDRETVREVERMTKRAGGQPIPSAVLRDVFAKTLSRGTALLSHEQLSRFLRRNLASTGTLTVTDLKLKEEKGKDFRFAVDCKARPETIRTWPHTPVLFFGALELPFTTGMAPWVSNVEGWIVTGQGAGLTLLLSTVITAFFVPNLMRKGTIDLLISKPIHRWYLLVCKFVGGLSFMFITTVVIVVGVWVVLGVRTGLWSTAFLLGIFVLTLQFAILYAVSVLTGVLTRNPIVSILVTCAWWFVLFLVGNVYVWVDLMREAEFMPTWAVTTADVVHLCLPHYKDLDLLSGRLIAADLLPKDNPSLQALERMTRSIQWPTSLGITFGFIVLILGLACWRFSVKDY
jgi:ABC-type transport system involved in multi-copper enzyme maturation permease subunit